MGLSPDTLHKIREGQPTGDTKRDMLVAVVRHPVQDPGTLPDAQLQGLLSAGYSGEDVVHIALAISVITFTNVFNRINDTVVDFPTPQ